MKTKDQQARYAGNWEAVQLELSAAGDKGISYEQIVQAVKNDMEFGQEHQSDEVHLTSVRMSVRKLLAARAEESGFVEINGKWYRKAPNGAKKLQPAAPAPEMTKGLEIRGPAIDIAFRRERKFRNVAAMSVLDDAGKWTSLSLLGSISLVILPAKVLELTYGQSQLVNAIKICILQAGLEPVELLVEKDEVVILQPL